MSLRDRFDVFEVDEVVVIRRTILLSLFFQWLRIGSRTSLGHQLPSFFIFFKLRLQKALETSVWLLRVEIHVSSGLLIAEIRLDGA